MTRFRTKMYPSDELASGKVTPSAKVPVEVLNAGPARFESGPPKEWVKAHEDALFKNMKVVNMALWGMLKRARAAARVGHPVPRLASHHYASHLTSSATTFYFY